MMDKVNTEDMGDCQWLKPVWDCIDSLEELRVFLDKAFVAHPNLDLDIEALDQ